MCRLPVAVRGEIARRGRSGESFRSIAMWTTNEGYPIGKDAIARHLRSCVGLDDVSEVESPRVGAVLVPTAVADVFERWPDAASRCASALESNGLHEAALIVQSKMP